jgi:transposase
MGRQTGDQSQLFYLFNLEDRIPSRHLLRRINPIVARVLAELREKLEPFYSELGRPSIDRELMMRMLIVGYCYGLRSERKLCEEVELHLAYRWFCRLDLVAQLSDVSPSGVLSWHLEKYRPHLRPSAHRTRADTLTFSLD